MRMWDGRTGAFLFDFEDRPFWATAMVFDPTGEVLLSADSPEGGSRHETQIKRWSTRTGELLGTVDGLSGHDSDLDPTTGRIVTITWSRKDSHEGGLWNAATGERLATVGELGGDPTYVTFGPLGNLAYLRVHGSEDLLPFDLETGQALPRIPAPADGGKFERACFTAGPERLITGDGAGRVQWWDPRAGTCLRTDEPHGGPIQDLRATVDGSVLVTGSRYEPVRAWDTRTGVLLWEAELDAHGHGRASTIRGGRVAVWESRNRFQVRELRSGRVLSTIGSRAALYSDWEVDPRGGHVALVSPGQTPRWLELDTARVTGDRTGVAANLDRLCYSADGLAMATFDEDGTVRLLRSDGGGVIALLEADEPLRPGGEQVFSPDGTRVAARLGDHALGLWSAATGEPLARFAPRPETRLEKVAWNRDGTRIGTLWSDDRVRILDGSGGSPAGVDLTHGAEPLDLDFHPNGRWLVTGSDDGYARIWDLETGEVLQELFHEDWLGTFAIRRVEFSPDGYLLVSTTGDAGQVHLWDLESGESQWVIDYMGGNPSALFASFNADGTLVLVHGQTSATTRIVDVADGSTVADLEPLDVDELDLTLDERRLVAVHDGALVVLDARTLERRLTCVPFERGHHLAFSPAGYFDGTPGGVAWTRVRVGGESRALAAYASVLYDPKKLAASARGLATTPPRLPAAPRIELRGDRGRFAPLEGDRVVLEARAGDPGGVLGFEVLQDGAPLPESAAHRLREAVRHEEEGAVALLHLELPVPPDRRQVDYRVRAVGRSGVLSRPVLLGFRR